MDYSTDTLVNDEFLVLAITIFIGGFLITAFYIRCYLPFKEEKDYIKMELVRSFEEEEEYRYWQKELKQLYLRSIPLIGRFFR